MYQKKKKNSRVSSLKSNCGPGDMKKKREEHGKKKKVLCVLCLVLFNAATTTSGKKRCSHAKSKKKRKKTPKKTRKCRKQCGVWTELHNNQTRGHRAREIIMTFDSNPPVCLHNLCTRLQVIFLFLVLFLCFFFFSSIASSTRWCFKVKMELFTGKSTTSHPAKAVRHLDGV